jgi:hypothetical protein
MDNNPIRFHVDYSWIEEIAGRNAFIVKFPAYDPTGLLRVVLLKGFSKSRIKWLNFQLFLKFLLRRVKGVKYEPK